jgi:hypothetical protein
MVGNNPISGIDLLGNKRAYVTFTYDQVIQEFDSIPVNGSMQISTWERHVTLKRQAYIEYECNCGHDGYEIVQTGKIGWVDGGSNTTGIDFGWWILTFKAGDNLVVGRTTSGPNWQEVELLWKSKVDIGIKIKFRNFSKGIYAVDPVDSVLVEKAKLSCP